MLCFKILKIANLYSNIGLIVSVGFLFVTVCMLEEVVLFYLALELLAVFHLILKFRLQQAALTGPPDILVSTPACIQKCLSAGLLATNSINDSLLMLILDEV